MQVPTITEGRAIRGSSFSNSLSGTDAESRFKGNSNPISFNRSAPTSASNSPSQYQQTERLTKAAQYGDLQFIKTAVECYNVSPNFKDSEDCSLLHWAAINNRLEVVKFLLEHKANVNIVGGENQEIPLQWAVRIPSTAQLIRELIREGADLEHKSAYGYDALFLAVQSNHVHLAYILLHSGANVNTVDLHDDTPLYWLLKNPQLSRSIDMQRLLFTFHASVNHKGKDDNIALHIIANSNQNVNMESALMVYLADPSSETIYTRNVENKTPTEIIWKTRNASMMKFFHDANMYANYPRWIPIGNAALMLVLFFVCVELFGWMYGMGAYALVLLSGDLLNQRTIQKGMSRSSCGFAWGIIISATGAYYIYLSELFSLGWDILIGTTVTAIIYTLVSTMNTKPLHKLDRSTEGRERIVEKILDSPMILDVNSKPVACQFKLCTTCLTDRSLVTTHCMHCDICVVDLDHHCPFVNNCVARGNRRMFVWFTITASFGCFLMSLISFYAQHNIFCADAKGLFFDIFAVQQCMFLQQNQRALPLITWLAFLTALWIFCICWGQIGLVASETTTYEILKFNNHGNKPFTWKGIRNIWNFFLTGNYNVVSPTSSDCQSCTIGVEKLADKVDEETGLLTEINHHNHSDQHVNKQQ